MAKIRKLKNAIAGISVMYVLLGVVLTAKPETSTVTVCQIFGAIGLILGAIRIAVFFRGTPSDNLFQFDLVQGIAYALVGAFMLISPRKVVSLLHMVLGIGIVIDSLLRLQLAANLKRLRHEQWWVYLTFTLMTAVLGTLLICYPFEGSVVLTRYVGISLVVNGAVNLWGIVYITRVFRNWSGV